MFVLDLRNDGILLVIGSQQHGTKSQKASVIDAALKASQKTMFFNHKKHE
jgi:hypothetical protein